MQEYEHIFSIKISNQVVNYSAFFSLIINTYARLNVNYQVLSEPTGFNNIDGLVDLQIFSRRWQ